MAFATTGYKLWAVETNKATSPEYVQYLEVDVTGANTDVAYDFGTTGGTFWTSAEGHATYGAKAIALKAIMYDICGKAMYPFHPVGDQLTAAYVPLAAASGATNYILANGTVSKSVDLTFKSGNAPTSHKLVLSWKMQPGFLPYSVVA